MTLQAWYEHRDREPRVAIAQLFMWLSCGGALYGLSVLVLLGLTGHTAAWSAFVGEPVRSAFTLLVLALYIASATLIGQRRPAGGLIGLALFGSMLLEQAWRDQLVSLSSAWAVLGIVLILRAGRALRLPFLAVVNSRVDPVARASDVGARAEILPPRDRPDSPKRPS